MMRLFFVKLIEMVSLYSLDDVLPYQRPMRFTAHHSER
jgi:hypothetical protein